MKTKQLNITDFKKPEDFLSYYKNLNEQLLETQKALYQLSFDIADRMNIVYSKMNSISQQVTQTFKAAEKIRIRNGNMFFLDFNHRHDYLRIGAEGCLRIFYPIQLHKDDSESFMCSSSDYLLSVKETVRHGLTNYSIDYPIGIDTENSYVDDLTIFIPSSWLLAKDDSWEDEYRQMLTAAINDMIAKQESNEQASKAKTKEEKLKLFNMLKIELGL